MTLLARITMAKMTPPTEGEIRDNGGDIDGDIDRWENDGGMNSGAIHDRSRN